MSERGCTAAMLFVASFFVGAAAITFSLISTSGGGGPYVGGAIASVGLVAGVLGGLLFAAIVTALALSYMKKG